MKILIIGCGGQLGTDCVNILGADHQITGIDYPDIDIADRSSVKETFEKTSPNVVVNCAAYTAVDKCETEQEVTWKINAEGPKHISKLANTIGCRVIHVSTDYVFDGKKTIPEQYNENDPVNPLSEYGRSKLAGEKAVIDHSSDHVILRTAWLYSAYGQNFLKTMLRLALSDPKRQFTIVNDQYGSLTWSHTLARQIGKLVSPEIQGVVHTTSTGYSTWYEAACYFLDKMQIPHSLVPCTTENYPTPAHRPANSILANKVLEDHHLSVFRSWQEDVDNFVYEFRDSLLEEAETQLKA